MWKLDFFILPSNNYQAIDENEAYMFGEKADYLDRNEKIYVPDEFYDIQDKNNITALDFLYGNEQNDISDYISEVISKRKTCTDTYAEIRGGVDYGYLTLSDEDITEEISHICVRNVRDKEEGKCIKVNDVVQIKRFYLSMVSDFKIFEERAKNCFPDIVFHQDAFLCVEKLGKYADVAEELIRHLTILNDVGRKLYFYYQKNEKAALAELKSGYHIECSGKGANEEKSYHKEIIFNDKKFQLTCNPHTKLYGKRTDQRIYFCWGRDEIKNHSLIVVRIGDHWV